MERFNYYYAEYYEIIKKIVSGILYNKSAAEDVAQDVFANYLSEQISGIDNTHIFKWLCVIARNKAVDYNRKWQAENKVVTKLFSNFKNNTNNYYLDAAGKLTRNVLDALWQKDHYWHCVIVLKAIEGNTYAETAEIKKISTDKVKNILYQARKWLSSTELYPNYKEVLSR